MPFEPETYARALGVEAEPNKGRADWARLVAPSWAAGNEALLDALQALPRGFKGQVVFVFSIREGDGPFRLADLAPAENEESPSCV